jgi:hypothetical protein
VNYYRNQASKEIISQIIRLHFAKSLVAQQAPPSVSNKDIQGSNPPSPNYQIINKKKKKIGVHFKLVFGNDKYPSEANCSILQQINEKVVTQINMKQCNFQFRFINNSKFFKLRN